MKALLLLPVLLLQVPERTADGFRNARPGHVFRFPADHGSHSDFRSEWWYYTGMLRAADGRQYGFQLTFFRQASPISSWKGNAHWQSDQIYLAHAALSDVWGGRFSFDEHLNRSGIWASAATGTLELKNGPWTVKGDGARQRLQFEVKGAHLELDLTALTPPVIFGESGVSRKGEDPSAASHYVTFPRMRASGTLRKEGLQTTVSGEVWMDHEWSSNQLGQGQVGWDWAGLRLNDGRNLMAYRLRSSDGRPDPWSTLTEVDVHGRISRRTRTWSMKAVGQWTSPHSRATYPLPLQIEAWGERWTLEPLLLDQELRTQRSNGITYWEGACRVRDASGKDVGEGYLEMTGYAGSLKGRF